MQPGSRARFVMLALIFITTVLNYVDRANLALTAPAIAAELGTDPAELGWLLSAFGWTYAASQIPGGWLVDRLRPRTLLCVLLALWSLCTLGIGFVSTMAAIFALRLAVGVLEAPSYPVNNRVITAWFPQGERASAAATFLSGQFVGLAFCMPLLAWLQAHHGWRSVFHATGVAGLLWAFAWYAIYRDPPHAPATRAKTSWRDLGALLSRRKLWGIYIGQFAVSTTLWFFLTWFPTYLVSYRGMDALRAGFMASVPYVAALVGVLMSGLVSDALLRRGFSLGVARKAPIITGLALAISIAGSTFVTSEAGLITFMAIAFFGCGMASITWAVVSAIAPTRLLGLTSGVFNLIGNSAAVVTPLVVGKLAAGPSGFTPALLYVAVVAALGVAAYLVLVGEVAKLPDPAVRHSLVVMGVSGAGKTTFASALAAATGVRFVEGDDFHSAENKAKMARGEGLTDADRAPWLAKLANELRDARLRGEVIILTCSALKRAYRDELRAGDPQLRLVFVHYTLEHLRQKLRERPGHFVDEKLLDSQLATLEPPQADERPIAVQGQAALDLALLAE
jgi:ACS family D-galactonate transporter-like MFS transporter